jgi:acetylornithine deacetylase/succinyl-diaminopimelate desuccinylase-like protein
MAKVGKLLYQLDTQRLPVHVTPVVRQMLETMAAQADEPVKSTLIKLLNPDETDAVLDQMGEQGLMFDALLHNTVEPTVVHGGDKINVLPSEIVVKIDARLLPGFGPDDLVSELRQVIGEEIELELIRYEEVPAEVDVGLYDTLTAILREADPEGVPVPLLLFAASDGRIFSRLGIQTYGFLPMNLPREFRFLRSIHAADERISVEALEFGTDAMFQLVSRYAG